MQNSELIKGRGGITLTERHHNMGQRAVSRLELHYGICLQSSKIMKNMPVWLTLVFSQKRILGIR
jgi:hypothetical protein